MISHLTDLCRAIITPFSSLSRPHFFILFLCDEFSISLFFLMTLLCSSPTSNLRFWVWTCVEWRRSDCRSHLYNSMNTSPPTRNTNIMHPTITSVFFCLHHNRSSSPEHSCPWFVFVALGLNVTQRGVLVF